MAFLHDILGDHTDDPKLSPFAGQNLGSELISGKATRLQYD